MVLRFVSVVSKGPTGKLLQNLHDLQNFGRANHALTVKQAVNKSKYRSTLA